MRAALAILAVALVAVPAADGYRNPTAGKALVLQLQGMHRAKVKRNVVYQRSPKLRMDVYRPRNARGRLPAVLLGGPPGSGRTSGQKVGWAQLIAASGLSAVAFDIRSDGRLQSPRNPAAGRPVCDRVRPLALEAPRDRSEQALHARFLGSLASVGDDARSPVVASLQRRLLRTARLPEPRARR